MKTAWCPKCRSEYRDGIAVCADCGSALVAVLPPEVPVEHHGITITGPFSPDDDLVELTKVPSFQAEVVAAGLRGASIPAAVFAVGSAGLLSAVQYAEGSRVMVRRADLEVAEQVVAELLGEQRPTEPIDDDELAALAESSAGWSDPETGAVV